MCRTANDALLKEQEVIQRLVGSIKNTHLTPMTLYRMKSAGLSVSRWRNTELSVTVVSPAHLSEPPCCLTSPPFSAWTVGWGGGCRPFNSNSHTCVSHNITAHFQQNNNPAATHSHTHTRCDVITFHFRGMACFSRWGIDRVPGPPVTSVSRLLSAANTRSDVVADTRQKKTFCQHWKTHFGFMSRHCVFKHSWRSDPKGENEDKQFHRRMLIVCVSSSPPSLLPSKAIFVVVVVLGLCLWGSLLSLRAAWQRPPVSRPALIILHASLWASERAEQSRADALT